MIYTSMINHGVLFVESPKPNTYSIKTMTLHVPVNIGKEDTLLPAMFNLLYTSMNQQLFKKISAIKVATIKITGDFHLLKASGS